MEKQEKTALDLLKESIDNVNIFQIYPQQEEVLIKYEKELKNNKVYW